MKTSLDKKSLLKISAHCAQASMATREHCAWRRPAVARHARLSAVVLGSQWPLEWR